MTFFLDRKLFKGNAALITDGSTAEEMLASVNANFTVIRKSASYDGREYPAHQLWIRQDNGNCLGCFGKIRNPQQPKAILESLMGFCAQSEKDLKPDVVGSINDGKTIEDVQAWVKDWRVLKTDNGVDYRVRLLVPHADNNLGANEFFIEGGSSTLASYAAAWDWWCAPARA